MIPARPELPESTLAGTPPFFSVITPSWNQGAFLPACVESVLAQDDPSFEHLVYDNCSADGTADVARRHAHLRFVSEPDRGQSHAVNKGLTAARGEIICWLNADDAYPPGVFARLRELFSDPDHQIVFGDVEQVTYDGRAPQRAGAVFEDRLDLVRWWTSRARLHQPAVFFRRAAAIATGLLREDLHYAMDYEYWWRLSAGHSFHRVPHVLAIQHRQPESKTVRAWPKVYEERERSFAPFYGLIDGGNPAALRRERSRVLSDGYLMHASAAAPHDPAGAMRNLGRAFREDPAALLRPAWLGVVRQLLRGRRAD